MPQMLGFLLYREVQDGASVEELSAALHLPRPWLEERIEAARLCLEKQVRVERVPVRGRRVSTAKANKRRSR